MRPYRRLSNVQNTSVTQQGLLFQVDGITVELAVLTPDLFRLTWNPVGPLTTHRSPAVIRDRWPVVSADIEENPQSLVITTEQIVLTIDLAEFHIHVDDGQQQPLFHDISMGWRDHAVRCWLDFPKNARIYGCGEKVGYLNRRGRRMEMWTTDVVPHLPNTDPMYQSIPFFMMMNEGRSSGIFFDNSHRSFFDFGKEQEDVVSFWAEDGEFCAYFFAGRNAKTILERYTELTGTMPLPPKWSMGFQQSRYSYYPEQKVREIATEFRRRAIPCDVIYFDIHYMNGYRVFTWDPQRFPEPQKLLDDLRADGFKLIPIIDPGVKIDPDYLVYREGIANDYFCRTRSGELFKGEVWPGEVYYPDFLKASTRQWWGELDADLVQQGFAGIWNDMNEPSNFLGAIDKDVVHGENGVEKSHGEAHNLYGFEMARATFDGLLRRFPDNRPFILTRSGYAGIQRYAAVWLGDNSSWWEHLAAAVPMLLNMGLSGVSFVGVDVGGFCDDCVPELFARWIALGCFTPFFRVHTAIGTVDQEPWSFGPEVETIARKYIKLRYELLPYIYDCFWEATRNGTPIMRPLWMEYPLDPKTYDMDDEYLFGPALLVAPLARPGLTHRAVYLPEGIWYDYWDDQLIEGPKLIVADAPLDKIPLYIRGGSVIFKEPVVNYVGECVPDKVTMDIYPGDDSEAFHYEDDGVSWQYLNGSYRILPVKCQSLDEGLQITIGAPQGLYEGSERALLLKIHGKKVRRVLINGKELDSISVPVGTELSSMGWYDEDKLCCIILEFLTQSRTIFVEY